MLSLYEILKVSKTGIAPDMWTALAGMNWGGKDSGAEVKELTGIPPLSIRSNGTMLLDYLISGNMSQTGTPTPTTPIQPNECGERTGNVMPAGELKIVENNGITFSSDGNGRYHISGTATAYASARFNLLTAFTTPISVSNGGQGTLSFFNTQSDNNVTFMFYNGATMVDDWKQLPIRRTTTVYNALGDKYVNSIVITVGSGTTVDMTITPEFTNDGILPSEFDPYGYKIPISSGGENLCNPTPYKTGYVLNDLGTENQNSEFNIYTAKVSEETQYCLSFVYPESAKYRMVRIHEYSGGIWQRQLLAMNCILYPQSFTTGVNIDEIRISIVNTTSDYMLNLGSEPLPYSPYNRTTAPIYLGEVPTTRKIKKLVLDGTESWLVESGVKGLFTLPNVTPLIQYNNQLCTHFSLASSYVNFYNTDLTFAVSTRPCLLIHYNDCQTVSVFKTFLASEYAAGHPVTVWYVLATEETGIVNEPIRKIGDYADTLSYEQAGVQIPTNRGNTVIDVETELKPSQMYIKYQE